MPSSESNLSTLFHITITYFFQGRDGVLISHRHTSIGGRDMLKKLALHNYGLGGYSEDSFGANFVELTMFCEPIISGKLLHQQLQM